MLFFIKKFFIVISYLFVNLIAINIHRPSANSHQQKSNQFYRYWHDQGAEICRYQLRQSRYGEIYHGEVFLIFVTEFFNLTKQVKSDDYRLQETNDNLAKILKINRIRRFQTGLYDYSVMTSVFKPIIWQYGLKSTSSLKVTLSIQDWCGQTFWQLNQKNLNNRESNPTTKSKKDRIFYQLQGFSYFESEGDQIINLKQSWLEDELLLAIRIDPHSLPLTIATVNPKSANQKKKTNFGVLPSLLYYRFSRKKPQIEFPKIKTKLIRYQYQKKSHAAVQYMLNYQRIGREVHIVYEKNFPHRIFSWQEIEKSKFQSDLKQQSSITTATLANIMFSAYWQKNKNSDKKIRKKLY